MGKIYERATIEVESVKKIIDIKVSGLIKMININAGTYEEAMREIAEIKQQAKFRERVNENDRIMLLIAEKLERHYINEMGALPIGRKEKEHHG